MSDAKIRAMIDNLKSVTSSIERNDPESKSYKKMRAYIASLDGKMLREIVKEKIKWVGTMSGTELIKRGYTASEL